MVNPINNDDAALMLSKFGTKYLAEGEHTDVSASQFVAQAATTLTVLTGGDAAISDNNKDYLASMSLGSVELKAGALIVAPNGELFKSITVATGGALVAYNSVIEGVKPGSFVGLLDTYPDAAAAYSLRKLRTDYSGSAIRVRRADNTEQDIGFVNNVLDTASLLSFVGSGDGFVATWYDQSSEGNNSTQSLATSQPLISGAGEIVSENGKPAIEFSAPFQRNLNLNNFPFTSGGEKTVIILANNTETQDSNAYNLADSSDIYALTYNRSGNNTYSALGAGSKVGGNVVNQSLISSFYKSTTQSFVDSVESTNTTNLARANFNDNTIGSRGSSYYHSGTIQEVIIYDSNKLTDRSAIETNINNFYSIY